uniref:Uncharacterized protein n=1 Tax=Tetranychus urticae TaxID=32264 RepID=T1KL34_TETUR
MSSGASYASKSYSPYFDIKPNRPGTSRTDGDANNGEDFDATPFVDQVQQGYLRIGGEQVHVYVTAWTNSLILAQDVNTDKDVPWGLEPDDSKLFRSRTAKEKEPKYRCRYCKQGFLAVELELVSLTAELLVDRTMIVKIGPWATGKRIDQINRSGTMIDGFLTDIAELALSMFPLVWRHRVLPRPD